MSNFFSAVASKLTFTTSSPREQETVQLGWKAPIKGPGKIKEIRSDSIHPISDNSNTGTDSISSTPNTPVKRNSQAVIERRSDIVITNNQNNIHGNNIENDWYVVNHQDGKNQEEIDDAPLTEDSIKAKIFDNLLNQYEVDLEDLKKHCWNGVPQKYRATCWQLLLGYLPTVSERRETTIEGKRRQYWDTVKQLWTDVDRSDLPEYENETLVQISKDVNRTLRSHNLFQCKEVLELLTRILYIWSMRHPASGYVQGINDLATPFICVFLQTYVEGDVLECQDVQTDKMRKALEDVEADVFWCLSTFIDSIQDNYVPSTPGIQRMLFLLKELVTKLDLKLQSHFDDQGIQYVLFAFRWMTCLLMREIPLQLVPRIWDTYLSEGDGFAILHVYVCAALIENFKDKLLTMDFSNLVIFLQALPTENWDTTNVQLLLSQAYVWRNAYHDSKEITLRDPLSWKSH